METLFLNAAVENDVENGEIKAVVNVGMQGFEKVVVIICNPTIRERVEGTGTITLG